MAISASKGFLLDEHDQQVLKQIVNRVNGGRFGKDNWFGEPNQPPRAPEVYIANVAGTIPARSGATPGSAYCDIYRIVEGEGLVLVSDFQQLVYNIQSAPITSGYITILRDKYGTWLTQGVNAVEPVLGVLDGDLLYGDIATVSTYTGAVNLETDTGENIYGVGCWLLNVAEYIPGGTRVICMWINDNWYVTEVRCPATGTGSGTGT